MAEAGKKSDIRNIPLCKAYVSEEEKRAISEVLDSGWYAHGPKCREFEESFAGYIGTGTAISLNSCTAALHLAIMANDIKGEVILPGFTFSASANAIVTAGAKPVFCDIDPTTYNMDPYDMEKRITPATRAIMPVHYAGLPCDMKHITEIAQKHDLMIIEDSAECIGGEFQGRKAGSFGIGCFSFYPTKNMTTGEGGMLTFPEGVGKDIIEKAKALKGHGIFTSTFEREKRSMPWLRSASHPGYNFRLSDILASMGIVQLRKLDEMNDKRRKNAAYLTKNMGIDLIQTPAEPKGYKHVYQMYTIRLDRSLDRAGFVRYLKEAGIGASVHFDPPVHKQEYYGKKYPAVRLPNTENVAATIVTLPMFPQLTEEEMDYMVEHMDVALKKMAKANV